MTSGIDIPVIAGLAVGVALIAVFSFVFKPSFIISDDEVRRVAGSFPEVHAFKERYPESSDVIDRDGSSATISYSAVRTWMFSPDPNSLSDSIGKTEFTLYVTLERSGDPIMDLTCSISPSPGNLQVVFHATVEEIKTNSCLDGSQPSFNADNG